MAQFRINEANLRKTIAFLREEPNRFTMLIWGYHSDAETTETFKKDLRNALAAHDEAVISIARKERPPCGTVCCFAGGAVLSLVPERVVFDPCGDMLERDGESIQFLASTLLTDSSIDEYRAHAFWGETFHLYRWSFENRCRYNDVNKTDRERVEILVNEIELKLAFVDVEIKL